MATLEERLECERLVEDAMKQLSVAFPGRVISADPPTSDSPFLAEDETGDGELLAAHDEEGDDFPSDPQSSFFRTNSDSSEFPSLTPEDSPQNERDMSSIDGGSPRNFKASLSSLFRNVVSLSGTKSKAIGIPLLTSQAPQENRHAVLLGGTFSWPKEPSVSANSSPTKAKSPQIAIGPVFGIATRLIVSHDTGAIAAGLITGQILVWFPICNDEVKPDAVYPQKRPDMILEGHEQGISCLLFLSGGVLVSGSLDHSLAIWRLDKDREVDSPKAGKAIPPLALVSTESVPSCLALPTASGGSLILVGSVDGTVRFWNIVTMKPLQDHIRYTDPVTCISVSSDSSVLAVGSSCGIVILYSLQTLRLDAEVDCRNRQGSHSAGRNVVGLEWSRDNQFICVTSLDSRVRVIHLTDLSRRTKFKAICYSNENLFNHTTFVSRERRIAGLSETGQFCFWDVHGGAETNEAASFCSLLDQPPLGISSSRSEVTASVVLRHIPNSIIGYFPFRVLPDQVMAFVADTEKRVNVFVEVLPK